MNTKINAIDNYKLQIAINDDAKMHSEKTLRNAIGLVKTVINLYAPLKKIDVSLPAKEKYEPETLTVQQIGTLINAVKGDEAELAILLALWLGLRASEIAALTWECYNSEERTFYIKQATVSDKDNKFIVKGTKTTNSKRKVSLPVYISEILDNTPHNSNKDFIIKMRTETAHRHLQRICKANGLPIIRLHDLRHVNASIMLLLGTPQKYTMERGGWSSSQTMEKIYQHTLQDEKKQVDENINDFISNLIKAH